MKRVTRISKGGRISKFTEEMKDDIVQLFNDGKTQREIAQMYDVSLSTIQKILRERR